MNIYFKINWCSFVIFQFYKFFKSILNKTIILLIIINKKNICEFFFYDYIYLLKYYTDISILNVFGLKLYFFVTI